MAGKGFRAAVRIVKAIDKAGKRAAREAEKRRKQEARAAEQAYKKSIRENEKRKKEQERAARQAQRDAAAREKVRERELKQAEAAREKLRIQRERDQANQIKAEIRADKEKIKREVEAAKSAYMFRCEQREALRNTFIDKEIR